MIGRTQPRVRECDDSENDNDMAALPQRLRESESKKDSARGEGWSKNKSAKDE